LPCRLDWERGCISRASIAAGLERYKGENKGVARCVDQVRALFLLLGDFFVRFALRERVIANQKKTTCAVYLRAASTPGVQKSAGGSRRLSHTRRAGRNWALIASG